MPWPKPRGVLQTGSDLCWLGKPGSAGIFVTALVSLQLRDPFDVLIFDMPVTWKRPGLGQTGVGSTRARSTSSSPRLILVAEFVEFDDGVQ